MKVVSEAVGDFLKQYRMEQGLTMDDIAAASRRYGSGWSSATIVSLERGGSKADSIPTILILLASLNDLRRRDGMRELCLSDVFCGVRRVKITSLSSMDVNSFLEDLSGAGVRLRPADEDEATPYRALHVPTATEVRAAKRLGISPNQCAYLCYRFLGRTLDQEIVRRVGVDASPQKRGRATRNIIAEMSRWLEAEGRIYLPQTATST